MANDDEITEILAAPHPPPTASPANLEPPPLPRRRAGAAADGCAGRLRRRAEPTHGSSGRRTDHGRQPEHARRRGTRHHGGAGRRVRQAVQPLHVGRVRRSRPPGELRQHHDRRSTTPTRRRSRSCAAEGTSGYDMVVPTGVYIPQMVERGSARAARPRRGSQLHQHRPGLHQPAMGPGNKYSVCKDWGRPAGSTTPR